jgi:hypothetical protein
MSNLKGFILQANQGLIHKDTGLYDVLFTHRISDAYLFTSLEEIDVFRTLRGLNSMSLTCYQIEQKTQ